MRFGAIGLGAFLRVVLSRLGLVWFVFNGFVKMLLRLSQLRKPSCRELVEKARGVCAETARNVLVASRLSRMAHVASVWDKKNLGREETLSGICVGDTGADVWLQAVWNSHGWEIISRKYVVTNLGTLLGKKVLVTKISQVGMPGEPKGLMGGTRYPSGNFPVRLRTPALRFSYLVVFQGTVGIRGHFVIYSSSYGPDSSLSSEVVLNSSEVDRGVTH